MAWIVIMENVYANSRDMKVIIVVVAMYGEKIIVEKEKRRCFIGFTTVSFHNLNKAIFRAKFSHTTAISLKF